MESNKFKLYIVEDTSASKELVKSLKLIFDSALKKNYELEIVDVLKNPELAVNQDILTTPTLIMELPKPEKRLFGNLSDENTILLRLDILTRK